MNWIDKYTCGGVDEFNGQDRVPGGSDRIPVYRNGIFGRKVTYRADVKKITKEEGKIIINICVMSKVQTSSNY